MKKRFLNKIEQQDIEYKLSALEITLKNMSRYLESSELEALDLIVEVHQARIFIQEINCWHYYNHRILTNSDKNDSNNEGGSSE